MKNTPNKHTENVSPEALRKRQERERKRNAGMMDKTVTLSQARQAQLDEVFLLDIYPARELPIEGVTSTWLLEKISNKQKRLVSKSNLLAELHKTDAEVILTIGAGDIGEEVKHIKKEFSLAN